VISEYGITSLGVGEGRLRGSRQIRRRVARPYRPPEETLGAVRPALDAGYRHIDTAAAYGNERQVGEAVHDSDVDRSEVFLETKIWISDYGYHETLHGFEKSARSLGESDIARLAVLVEQARSSEAALVAA
jgi:diketogulonate reductase-like aldo/keto reductase